MINLLLTRKLNILFYPLKKVIKKGYQQYIRKVKR